MSILDENKTPAQLRHEEQRRDSDFAREMMELYCWTHRKTSGSVQVTSAKARYRFRVSTVQL